ncbi:MAG: membrane dipeptidase [Rhodothermales bacterium]|nr:membrane dipeptidase [Rhodothermales bacterium]
MRTSACLLILLAGAIACTQPPAERAIDPELLQRATLLTQDVIIADGHIDVPYRNWRTREDISQTTEGHFDHPRAKAGGLDAPFMSIYVPAERQQQPGASKALADSLIDMVEGFVASAPDKFALAYSVADVRENHTKGLVSLPMGMENGAGFEDDLANVKHFHERGIRYVTLAHSKVNLISDSSYDSVRTWNGLSDFGIDVVREMNQLGIMVDISHVTDSAFYDVLAVTTAPVIASHSSARHFTPGWERNMSDDMIRALGDNGGVIMINFGSMFISEDSQKASDKIWAYASEHDLSFDDEEMVAYMAENAVLSDIWDVADHIDHVVALVGIDHVGLGSDYDGVSWLPVGLEDVSTYPNLVAVLLERGYSNQDIEKILGTNLLRVWSQAERVARAS